MHLEALGEQVGGRLVVGLVYQREQFARGACRGFLGGDEQADHVGRFRHAFHLLDRGQLDELLVGAGRGDAEGADALGDQVERVPLLGVLPHEHQVQGVEHRPFDVPVEVVRHQVEGVAVGEQARQALGDFRPVAGGNADVDGGGGAFLRFHGHSFQVTRLQACNFNGITRSDRPPRSVSPAPGCGSGGRRPTGRPWRLRPGR